MASERGTLSSRFQPFESRLQFAYDLCDVGSYYRQHQKLKTYAKSVLPLKILDVKYERIVQGQELRNREIMDLCSLE